MEAKPVYFFAGLPGLESLEFTASTGRAPGFGRMVVHPNLANLARVSDLLIGDGIRSPIRLKRCLIGSLAGALTTSNRSVTLFFTDRRWEWQYRVIHGRYNIPVPKVFDRVPVPDYDDPPPPATPVPEAQAHPEQFEPQIQERTRKTARELGELCCKAMKEKVYDLRDLPDDQYPEVNWDAANPADELERLADLYGCRLVYRYDSDSVRVQKLGVGEQLPNPGRDVASDNLTIDPPELPQTIGVYGAPAEHQGRFQLEAVLPDFDGQIKPYDDVSYKPTNGWSQHGPPFTDLDEESFYADLPEGYTSRDAQALAIKYLYKLFRIKHTYPLIESSQFWIPFDAGTKSKSAPGVATFKRTREDIFITALTCETSRNELSGQRNILPARVYGSTLDGSPNYGHTGAGEVVPWGFDVDPNNGTVLFERECYTLSNNEFSPSELVLECACTVANPIDHQIERYKKTFGKQKKPKGKDQPSSSDFPGEHAIIRDDIRFFSVTVYKDTDDHSVVKVYDNAKQADTMADYYYRGELARYETQTPQDRTFNGIWPIYCDGAILQVTWAISTGGVYTRASRNTEHSSRIPSYPDRQRANESGLENLLRQSRTLADSRDLQHRLRTGVLDPYKAK